jgi:hypothetical protein
VARLHTGHAENTVAQGPEVGLGVAAKGLSDGLVAMTPRPPRVEPAGRVPRIFALGTADGHTLPVGRRGEGGVVDLDERAAFGCQPVGDSPKKAALVRVAPDTKSVPVADTVEDSFDLDLVEVRLADVDSRSACVRRRGAELDSDDGVTEVQRRPSALAAAASELEDATGGTQLCGPRAMSVLDGAGVAA